MIEYENLRKVNEPVLAELRGKFESVMSSGWFILGEEVRHFERDFAEYCGTSHCVGLASGLDARRAQTTASGQRSALEIATATPSSAAPRRCASTGRYGRSVFVCPARITAQPRSLAASTS